ncbi:MAG: tetratricopeptide repeat protein, partial [Gemmatimonadetes bacterium]|nr:tetratricopeptide repeat protein [Gemmatimonadota bacterium]
AWLLRLQAAVALAAGAYDKALDYDRRAVRRHFGNALAYDQLYRAQAFDGLRQRDSAIALYEEVASPRSIAAGPRALTLHLAYLPVLHQRLGELYADAGDRAKAAQHYAAFLELWSNPDPELRPQVEAARRALEQLRGERAGV